MVFVSMEPDELLTRTAQYLIQYHPRTDDPSAHGPSSSHGANRELMAPTQVISVRHHGDGSTSTRSRQTYLYPVSSDGNVRDTRTARMPPEFADNLPDFRVTTHCSDDEEEDSHDNSRGMRYSYRRPPNRIGSLPFEDPDADPEADPDFEPDSDSDGAIFPMDPAANEFTEPYIYYTDHRDRDPTAPRYHGLAAERYLANGTYHAFVPGTDPHEFDPVPTLPGPYPTAEAMSQHAPGNPPSGSGNDAALADAWEAHISATQDAVRAINKGYPLLAPHARFFIENKKSKCTIRFDPPVSGRFILLKMWSSHQDPTSNIDIQSVIATGFAGPRYFPSVELR